jgi:hypothetical protein
MNGLTLGLGRRFFFLWHPLTTTAATATIFLVTVRGVVVVIIWSALVTLRGVFRE